MMSAKLAPLGLFKINAFWNKVHHVISFIHDVTKNILLHESDYIEALVIWPKFGDSSISMREIIIASIL